MEFLMEVLAETVGEVFLNFGVEASVDHRLPKWLRVLILTATVIIFAAVFGIVLLVAIGALSHTPLMSLLLFALDAGLVFFCACRVRKILRTFSRK